MKSLVNHTVQGSIHGFLYQIQRALLWLSKGIENSRVGIETLDDVVVDLRNGIDRKIIFEQDKATTTGSYPYADKSEDLWKTLSIWAAAIKNKEIDVDSSYFLAVSNITLPASRLIRDISDSHISKIELESEIEKMDKCFVKVKETAGNLSSTLQKYGNKVLELDDSVLRKLIDKVELIEPSSDIKTDVIKQELKVSLSVSDKVPIDYLYRGLLGFVADLAIDKWKKGEEAWIEVQEFNDELFNLTSKYGLKSFEERAIDFLPMITNADLKENEQEVYVQQLKDIDCPKDEILEAMKDYIRSVSEKSRYAVEAEIPEQKFNVFYNDLKDRWKTNSRPRFQNGIPNYTDKQIGYDLYNETLKYKGKLNGHEPEQGYTYKGAYQHLSNELEICWHKKWKPKLKN